MHGIIRKIDKLGRVVIPNDIRKLKQWHPGTTIEFLFDGEIVTLNDVSNVQKEHDVQTLEAVAKYIEGGKNPELEAELREVIQRMK